jgi:transcriptional regulator
MLSQPYSSIVGFSLEIIRLEGKWKMSQNRTPHERACIAEELRKSQDPSVAVVGELVSGVRKRIADDTAP